MKYLTRLALVIAIGSACAPIAKSQDPTRNKGGAITGRVTTANKAVSGVMVTISLAGDALAGVGLTLKAVTDDEGRFRLSNLPAGTYYVWPFVPAFVVAEATGSYPQGKSVAVEDGETAEDINFNLDRGAVITGKILSANDEPLVAVKVRAIMIRDLNGKPPGSSGSSVERFTDDRGIYRLFGLLPGTYLVSAGGRGSNSYVLNAYDNDAPTYAPSSTRDTATEISLAGGEEKTSTFTIVVMLVML